MIPFQCPHCGLSTQVDPRYAGQSGPCAGCGKLIRVPLSSTAPAATTPGSNRRIPAWLQAALALSAALLAILLLLGFLGQLIGPAIRQARSNARQQLCRNQVGQLTRAMFAYRKDHGTLPPAYVVDRQGKRLHSWRVLLLPYLGPEAAAIYAQLKLDEPWDSVHNRQFASRVPPYFVCPDDRPFAVGDTSYCAVVGSEFAFPDADGIDPTAIRDDPAHTLLIVEVHNSGINWMQPLDVTANQLAQGINSGVRGTCGSYHPHGRITVGTADGQTHALSDAIPPDDLHDMATICGGESPHPPLSE